MKIKARAIGYNAEGAIDLLPLELENIRVTEPCIVSIDGSTDITGVGILRESDGAIMYSIAFIAEHKDESPVQYKVRLKRAMYSLIKNNTLIKEFFYEEPFLGYATAAPNLMMLRTFVEELKFEYEPELDYIAYTEVNNQKWKRLFLTPDKVPGGTEAQKQAVRNKLVLALPFLASVTQDEIDAIAMGFTAVVKLRDGLKEELKSRKKTRPFMYNIQFIGADSDENMQTELFDICEAPKSVLENGMAMINLSSRGNWDSSIYESMGSDDKLLILKFPSNRHGNIVLKYKIGHLTECFGYIYALVWRKARKN